jgi:hypothetical protein
VVLIIGVAKLLSMIIIITKTFDSIYRKTRIISARKCTKDTIWWHL